MIVFKFKQIIYWKKDRYERLVKMWWYTCGIAKKNDDYDDADLFKLNGHIFDKRIINCRNIDEIIVHVEDKALHFEIILE